MYVCVCNAITDRDARAQCEADRPTVAMVYRALGAKPTCGRCVPTMRQILRQAVELPPRRPVPAIG